MLRLRVSKPGYATAEDLTLLPTPPQRTVVLTKEADVPPGMVPTTGTQDPINTSTSSPAPNPVMIVGAPILDGPSHESTNREYKAFVDAGGYQDRRYWTTPDRDQASNVRGRSRRRFHDRTGRPGPSTWAGGDYPDGQDDYPVSGVSWYEAAAFLPSSASKSCRRSIIGGGRYLPVTARVLP